MTTADFLREVRSLLQEVNQQLQQRQAGIPGDGSAGELRNIQEELSKLEALAASDALPPPGSRWLGATRIVSDTWPFDSQLGQHISRLADLYKRRVQ
jgi:hypothetical protein